MKKLFQYTLFVTFGALPLLVSAQTITSITHNLYQGLKSDEVTLLQQKLQALGFFPKDTAPSGFFGVVTKKAVQDFQTANKIEAAGNTGPITRKALLNAVPGATAVATSTSAFSLNAVLDGTRQDCITSISKAQDDATAAAKKAQDDAKTLATTQRDNTNTNATNTLLSAKASAAGFRDAAFIAAKAIVDLNARTAAYNKAIATYNAAIVAPTQKEVSAQNEAAVTYANATAKAGADYAAAISDLTASVQAATLTCPLK